jgi:RND family efflux transporter MFP subunit
MIGKLNLAMLGAVLAVAGCSEADSKKSAEIRPVRTVTVALKSIEDDRRAIGDIRPRYESDMGFRLSGKVTKRLVDIGASVRQGDILAELDDQDYRNKLTSAETDVAGAQAVLTEARAAEGRLRHLLSTGHTTRANYDVSLKNLRSAEAKLGSAMAAAKLAADQVAYCQLRADFDGIVTATGVEPGQIVNTGQMAVRLARPVDKDAVFAIAEATFSGPRPTGARPEIIVQLLSNPAIVARGEVREIAPVADTATRTFLVKVTLHDPPEEMRFGAGVAGRLQASSRPVVVLPGSALFDRGGRPAVWVVDPEKRAVSLKPVEVARFEADRVVLDGGLTNGDIVVTAGVNRLREHQQVTLAEGSAK